MNKEKKNLILSVAFLIIGFVLFFSGILSDNNTKFFLALFVGAPMALVSSIFTIVRTVKYTKKKNEKKEFTFVKQNEPALSSNKDDSSVSGNLTDTKKKVRPIKFSTSFEFSFNGKDKVAELFKTYENVLIVGTQYNNLTVPLEYGASVDIRRDENNEYDNRAIAVFYSSTNERIGYLSKKSLLYEMANDYIDKDYVVLGKIDDEDSKTITMAFYRVRANKNSYNNVKSKKPLKTITVTLNEEQAVDCSIGEKARFETIDSDLYLFVGIGDELKMSQSVNDFLSGCNKNIVAYVVDFEELENYKTKAKIAIYEKN